MKTPFPFLDSLVRVTFYGIESGYSRSDGSVLTPVEVSAGRTCARNGFPLEVRIVRGGNSHIVHLTLGEACRLQEAIQAVREGKYGSAK